jgi:hypothetical protein
MTIPRWLGWFIFACVCVGLFVQVPRLIVRCDSYGRRYPTWEQVQAENEKAQEAWKHHSRDRESIYVVNHGDKAGLR